MTEQVAARPSLIRRIAENFSTPRKALTTVAKAGGTGLLIEGMVSGCAPATKTPDATASYIPTAPITTPGPSAMPSETAFQTQLATNTPEASASASPSATATETTAPGELNVTFASFIADLQAGGTALDKYTPISVADVTTAYNAFTADPDVKASGLMQQGPGAPLVFSECLDTKASAKDRQLNCASAVALGLQGVQKLPGNAAAQNYANGMARYDVRSGLYNTAAAMNLLLTVLQS